VRFFDQYLVVFQKRYKIRTQLLEWLLVVILATGSSPKANISKNCGIYRTGS